ncbi:hypothetical protein M595_0433 [Lyngbya aestuarii BL J]|uniref:Uncharacterized protein n=1 Tax=Lyngbya aestuarii BL J TaxID=1348334 RepID=U7QTB0_9CYAN|nr:hypothetical protein M595_0433 [Lyngbya aestuarii BL J]
MYRLHCIFFSLLRQNDPGCFRIGEVGSHYPYRFAIFFDLMGAENFKGIAMMIPNNPVNLIMCDSGHGSHTLLLLQTG